MKKLSLLPLSALALALNAPAASADRIDDMISPAFHAVNFEDPRAISEARLLYVYHEINDDFVTQGGDAQVYALQLRYAITDKLAIIATKDGIVDLNPNAVVPHDTGIADIEAGLKYVFLENEECGQVMSAQLRYLIPVGDEDVLQGQGDGFIHPSFSGALGLGDNLTLTAGTGLRIPMDSADSSFWDVDAQLDYKIDAGFGKFYPLIGASLIHVWSSGERLPIADEGQDFFSLGATESAGENIVTGVAGLRFRPHDQIDLGVAYQFPFDKGEEGSRIIDYRWNFDLIFRF